MIICVVDFGGELKNCSCQLAGARGRHSCVFAGSKQRVAGSWQEEEEWEEEGALKQDIGGNRTCGSGVSVPTLKNQIKSTIKRRLIILSIDYILGLIMGKGICLDSEGQSSRAAEVGGAGVGQMQLTRCGRMECSGAASFSRNQRRCNLLARGLCKRFSICSSSSLLLLLSVSPAFNCG